MYKYSSSKNVFIPESIIDIYISAGTLPGDLVDVIDSVFIEFIGEAPAGKRRAGGPDGHPAWIDFDPASSAQLLADAISSHAASYKKDAYDLNMAYVAALVNDGESEAGKVAAVRSELTARKAKYMFDIAAARAQYPVE